MQGMSSHYQVVSVLFYKSTVVSNRILNNNTDILSESFSHFSHLTPPYPLDKWEFAVSPLHDLLLTTHHDCSGSEAHCNGLL